MHDTKERLSQLWLFALLNYLRTAWRISSRVPLRL
jgi:hypothetical protein